MITVAPLLLALVGSPDGTDVAHRVQVHLSAAAQPWLTRNARKLRKVAGDEVTGAGVEIVFEVEINKRGGFTQARHSRSSGNTKVDRLARGLFRVTPPLPNPPPSIKKSRRNTPCVIHLKIRSKAVDVTAACMPRGVPTQVAWRDDTELSQPAADLFQGWRYESTGDLARSEASFRLAYQDDPQWGLTALALGLHLARAGLLDEAKPLLKQSVTKKRKATREVKRYLKGKTAESTQGGGAIASGALGGDDDDGDLGVASCERDEGEIFNFIQKRYPKLNRCIDKEKKRRPGTRMPPDVPVNFVITPKGKVESILVDHRFFREGEMLGCFTKALHGPLKKSGGSNCPVQFEIEITTVEHTRSW